MGFPSQEYWSGLPFPSSEGLPDPGIKAGSPALGSRVFTTEPPGKPWNLITYHLVNLCVTVSLGHVLSFVSFQRPLRPCRGSSPKDGGHLGRSNSLCFLGSAQLLSRVPVMINCQAVFICLKFNLKNFLESLVNWDNKPFHHQISGSPLENKLHLPLFKKKKKKKNWCG